jgi:SAM-dependent methyltransferase
MSEKLKNDSSDPKKRFSDRVDDYIKFRPTYPRNIISFMEKSGLTKSSVIADIGSGTGLLTRLFLEYGNVVYGVEPNAEMRIAGETLLQNFSNFISINGSSENTTLNSDSIDFIIAGQAYHWFDQNLSKNEFIRILKQPELDNVFLIWNTRNDSTPFNRELEKIITTYSSDYLKVSHTQDQNKKDKIFFDREFKKISFPNFQLLDFSGLLGRLLSSSYMLKKSDIKFNKFESDLRSLYQNYQEDGLVNIVYTTEVFFGSLM